MVMMLPMSEPYPWLAKMYDRSAPRFQRTARSDILRARPFSRRRRAKLRTHDAGGHGVVPANTYAQEDAGDADPDERARRGERAGRGADAQDRREDDDHQLLSVCPAGETTRGPSGAHAQTALRPRASAR